MKNETTLLNFLSGPLENSFKIIRANGKLYSEDECEFMDKLEKALLVKASDFIRKTIQDEYPELESEEEIISQFHSLLQTVSHKGKPCSEET